MHHLSTAQSTVKDIFQLFSKFLSKMTENGILKTYTFLYSENYSCTEENYNNVMNAIDDFKDLLLKICSETSALNKSNICDTGTYNLLSSNSIDDCLPSSTTDPAYTNHNNESAFSGHNTNYNLYSGSSIHATIEQNIQFMTNNSNNMCNNLTQGIANNGICDTLSQNMTNSTSGICTNLGQTIDFASTELSNEQLKQTGQSINFNECNNMAGHINHLSYSTFKSGVNRNPSDMMPNYDVENVNYDKNSNSKMDLDSNIGLNGIHGNCNESLYNTLKEAISGDFLQNIKFPSVDTPDRPMERSMTFNEQVQYTQCAPTLQQIDLDILSNSNERINNALDRIFEDQFVENDALLEPECWNVDINLPSAEPMQPNMDLQTTEFELPSCAEDLKEKAIRTDLNNSLVSNFDDSPVENLERSVAADLGSSLHAMSSSMPATLNSSLSSTLSNLSQEKFTNDFEGDKYFCEHCGYICNTKLKLKIHLKRQHNVYINNLLKCDQCGKCFKRRRGLMTHMNAHKKIKPFECPYCYRTFTQQITLDSHIQIHSGMYKFPCTMCQKRFPTQAKLNFHSKSHEKPELRCDICSKMFTTMQYLNNHKKSHNKPAGSIEKSFSCMKCSMLFKKSIELSTHIKEEHPDVKFVCYYVGCKKSFDTDKKLKNHIYKQHSASKPIKKKVQNSKFECEICHIKFMEKSSYYRHNLLDHREKVDVENSHNCVHCDKRFTTESGLDDHLEKFHSASHSKDMDYSCSVCGSLFYEEKPLKEHMNIHSDLGAHLCQTCGAVFSQKSDYLVHKSIHNLKKQNIRKKFKCDACDTGFESKMELKQHELDIHNIVPDIEELKPYGCLYCEKRFTARGKCNLHMETHSDNRKYQCTMCTKNFFRRDLLKEHMVTHTGYRSHVCKTCGLGFTQLSSLRVHEAGHERTETFTCDTCNKVFKTKQTLNYHIKTHKGNFRFSCEVCGKKFVRECHYVTHVKCHSTERPFKCLKCSLTYKSNKHLRDHTKKAHQNEANFNSLLDSIYTEDEVISQQSLLDEYIPSINPLNSELMFPKT